MKRAMFTGIVIILVAVPGVCQYKKLRSFKIAADISYAAVDRGGDLYLIAGNGTIYKIDPAGKLLHSVAYHAPPTVFDPRDGSRLFAYYRDLQDFVFLSPSLTPTMPTYKVDAAFAIEPYLVCASGDQHILVLDAADWNLKKVSIKNPELVMEADIASSIVKASDLLIMREYQNFIFLLDRNRGIFIFNALGNLLQTIEVKGLSYFSFLGEELYYLENGKLKFFNLFTAETREAELPAPADFALMTDERLYLIQKNKVDILEFTP